MKNKIIKILKSQFFLNIISIIILSFIITSISFFYVWDNLDIKRLQTYFDFSVFILNYIPVLFIMILIWLIFKNIHWPFIFNSLLTLIIGVINQTKLIYRDDVLIFSDITIIKEASLMAQQYDLIIKKYTIIFAIFIVIMFFLLKKIIKKINIKRSIRLSLIVLMLILSILCYKYIYINQKIYDNVGDDSKINVWIQTRQYQIRGLIYPFIYTSKDFIDDKPDNYNEDNTSELLAKYNYENIPNDKKVNIIAVMLEAYNDFSKFDNLTFTEDIYAPLHKIQKKSLSGHLITSIFGGGTIDTERKFLTGYPTLTSFRRQTNSYAWYLKEQGYKTDAMHPIFGSFYNRNTVNSNLGFDNYYNYENKYGSIEEPKYLWSNYVNDKYLFETIKQEYEKTKKDKKPYFNFTVTYQNHGPYYGGNYEAKKYFIKNKGYNEESYNIINEYFAGIKKTNESIYDLITYFEKENEPVIVILFGDHNPYLKDAYDDLNIDTDLATLKGFLNYYETPYIIYGNKAAQKTFNKTFKGTAKDISPFFLMPELFEYINFKGNEYNQYLTDLKKNVDVVSNNFNKENKKYVISSKSAYKDKISEFNKVGYYWSHNYSTSLINSNLPK